MNRKLYALNLFDINGSLVGTINRHSYLPRHLFLMVYQQRVARGLLGLYVNSVSFSRYSDIGLPSTLTFQAS